MSTLRRVPVVEVVLERTRYSWVWVVPTCPYCGKPHEHYGGPLDNDPHKYLAHRITSTCNIDDQQALAMRVSQGKLQYILQAPAKRETELRHEDARAVGQADS